MRGLAGLDGLLDQGQHLRRKDAPHPPAVLHQMLADAFDAHNQLQTYQLPDAPPPPKLPPPPEKPPLSLEPLEKPPPPPPMKPPLRPPPPDAKLSANIVRKKAMTADTAHSASEPIRNHATTPMMPPVATEPTSLPSTVREMPPTMVATKMRMGNISSRCAGSLKLCVGSGAGNGSPSITEIIRSTPSEMPPVKSPLRNFGVMTSLMIRLAVASVRLPSRPYPTSIRSLWSFLATTSSAPSSIFLRPIFHASATRIEYCSMVSGAVVGTISTATWLPFRSSSPLRTWVSEAMVSLDNVPVWSTTRPDSGGTATSAKASSEKTDTAKAVNAQHINSARKG